MRNLQPSNRLLYSSALRADIRPFEPRKVSGGRRDGNAGRSERSGEIHTSVMGSPENLGESQIPSKMVAEVQDPLSLLSPDSRDVNPLVASNDRRDSRVATTTKQGYIPIINGNQLVNGSDSSGHVGSTPPFNETVSLDDIPIVAGSNVNITSSAPELRSYSPGGLHGTVHVEKEGAAGLVFSADGVKPGKQSTGKWKKEARLKGVIGPVSSSSVKLKNVKRKMDMGLLADDVAKVQKTEGLSLGAKELAEAVSQPRQGQ